MAYGIKETKEVLDLILTGVNIGVSVAADGKISVEDGALLMQLFPVVGPALSDISLVPQELGELSAEESAELIAHVGGKLTIGDAHVAAVINKSLKLVHAGFELFMEFKQPSEAA